MTTEDGSADGADLRRFLKTGRPIDGGAALGAFLAGVVGTEVI